MNEEASNVFIAQQSFFVPATDRESYEDQAAVIRSSLSRQFGERVPATSIVSQRPDGGEELALELICMKNAGSQVVSYRRHRDLSYTLIEEDGQRSVICAGLSGKKGDTISKAAEHAFKLGLEILEKEGLKIGDIVRQWNYIEDIASVKDFGSAQNYQDFNDVRASYYRLGDFSAGYPTATGIGQATGGVVIDFLAVSDSGRINRLSINNPGQTDAHKYSKRVLEGRKSEKCRPLFERAQLLEKGPEQIINVSGTASIQGEDTMYIDDVEKQTLLTIENIHRLVAPENLRSQGVSLPSSGFIFKPYRVYVKYPEDIPSVRAICEDRLGSRPALYLEADICRENLLVEIDGVCI